MNDQQPPDDPLARAARALRDAAEVRTSGPATQRGQILARAHANQQSAERRAAVGMALSAVLVTSTAIAAATGNLPKVVAVVQRAVGLAPAESLVPQVPAQDDAPAVRKVKIGRPVAELPGPEPVADAQPAPAPEPPAAPELPAAPPPQPEEPQATTAPQSPPPELARAPKPRLAPEGARRLEPEPKPAAGAPAPEPAAGPNEPPALAAPPEPPAAAPAPSPPDETLVLFRSAQALQFRDKAYAKALAGWEAYLRAAPGGALAPEARWNRAVCLLRLGRKPEARIALEPFAQGMEGGYRQAEAARLIAALQEGAP